MNRYLRSMQKTGAAATIRNIGWMSVGRAVRMSGSLIVGTMVVRYLGPDQFGNLSYAIAVYGLFNILSNLGLDYLVVSDVVLATGTEEEEEILGTSFFLKGAASFVTSAAAVLYCFLTRPNDHTVLDIVAMLSLASILQAFDVVDFYFQAKTQSKQVVLPQIVAFFVSNCSRVIAVVLHASLMTFGLIAAAEIAAYEIALAFAYLWQHRNLSKWRFRGQRAIILLKASWPLIISSVLITVYMRTDQVMLGMLSTPRAVGEYSAAVKISEIWYIVPTIIGASVMPRLLKHKESDPQLYRERMQKLYGAMAAFSIVVALATTLCCRLIVKLLFGAAYLSAANVLALHVWTGPFVFLGVISGIQVVHENITHITMQRSVVGAIANVLLNLLLIPRFGSIGSAAATLVAQILAAYLMDTANRSTRGIFRMKTRALTGLWLLRTNS